MGIENIRERILQEATQKAASIKEEAFRRLEEELRSFEISEERRFENELKENFAELSAEYSKKLNAARLDSERRILAKKRELLNRLFEETQKQILNLSTQDYLGFLKRLILRDSPSEGEFVIWLSDDDLKKYRKEIEKFALETYGGRASVSRKPAKISGGVQISSERFLIDNSIEAILSEYKDKSEIELSKKLFED